MLPSTMPSVFGSPFEVSIDIHNLYIHIHMYIYIYKLLFQAVWTEENVMAMIMVHEVGGERTVSQSVRANVSHVLHTKVGHTPHHVLL